MAVAYSLMCNRPHMKQPYRGAHVSVPITGQLRDKYEPLQPRFVADSRNLTVGRAPPEGVSVYRTPALLKGDDITYLCDGGLEKLPTADMLSATDKPYMQNPPNYFDRNSTPLFYKMVSELILSFILYNLMHTRQAARRCCLERRALASGCLPLA
jgi:hypothetical protein